MTVVGQQIPDLDTSDMAVPPLLSSSTGDRFHEEESAVVRRRRGRPHGGTDFQAATGTTVYSPRDGIVVCVLPPEQDRPKNLSLVPPYHGSGFYGYGGVVGIWHYQDLMPDERSVYTMYAHLKTALVAVGDHVHAGTPIALTDATHGNPPTPTYNGLPMAPHLHAELRAMRGHPGTIRKAQFPFAIVNTPFPETVAHEFNEDIEPYLARFGIHYTHRGSRTVRIDPGSPAERGLRMMQEGGPPPVSARDDSPFMQSPLPQRRGTPDRPRAGTFPVGPAIAIGAFVGLVAFTIVSPAKR